MEILREKEQKKTGNISIREKEIITTKRYMKINDTIAAILAVLSAIFCYYENELFYDAENPGHSSTANSVLRGIIIIFTLALCNYNFVSKSY